MKKLIVLGILVGAAWYGWKNYPALFERRPSHEAVVENAGTASLERVRVTVDGQTLVRETIPAGGKATLPFRVNRDSNFEVRWEWNGRIGEHSWAGGTVPRGPMTQRHVIHIDDDNEVSYRPENK
jgi:hypothetical protein